MKLMSSFEEFSERVMHPLEMSSAQSAPTTSSHHRASPTRILSSHMSVPSIVTRSHYHHKGGSPSPHSLSSQSSHSPKATSLSSFLKIPTLRDRVVDRFSPPLRRQRASTNDDRIQASPKCKAYVINKPPLIPTLYPHTHPTVKSMRRNSSVPDLSEIDKLSVPVPKSISDSNNKLLDICAEFALWFY